LKFIPFEFSLKKVLKLILFLVLILSVFIGGFVVGAKVVLNKSDKANAQFSHDIYKIISDYDQLLLISETKSKIDSSVINAYINQTLNPNTINQWSQDWNNLDLTQKNVRDGLIPLLNKYGLSSSTIPIPTRSN